MNKMNANTADLSRTDTKIKIFQPVTVNSVCSLHEYCVGNNVEISKVHATNSASGWALISSRALFR